MNIAAYILNTLHYIEATAVLIYIRMEGLKGTARRRIGKSEKGI